MMQGKVQVKQCILIDPLGMGQRYGEQRESMGACSATCGELHDLWGGAKGGQAEGGYTCSRQLQQEALDGLGVQ